ncbi:hypothetical protein O0L34_g1081 [Tuta absoluta]|nr:hypothetical protein O0L34_g1081 [Tuta absoluta]
MPLQRSPPPSPAPQTENPNNEETDPSKSVLLSEFVNKENRAKRPRSDLSPDQGVQQTAKPAEQQQCTLADVKKDLLTMLKIWKLEQDIRFENWKKDQDATLATLGKDVA